MRLEIHHISNYTYEAPIFLEPQHLYFKPLYRPYLSIESYDLKISPPPSGKVERVDMENNSFQQCWFNESIPSLSIDTKISIKIHAFNPFDFLEESTPKTQHTEIRAPYLQLTHLSHALTKWVNRIRKDNPENSISFLSNLCSEIHNSWDHQARYDSSLHTPDQCFQAKEGSCRDLSWMMIQMLRHVGMPSRFVSGYSYNPELGEGHELHAWVEAYIEGGGWIGLDPSSGLFTTEYYIPVATSHHPVNTLPVQGSYRGSATSHLKTSVTIKLID